MIRDDVVGLAIEDADLVSEESEKRGWGGRQQSEMKEREREEGERTQRVSSFAPPPPKTLTNATLDTKSIWSLTSRTSPSLNFHCTGRQQTISGQSEQVMEKKPCNDGLAEVSRSVRDLRPAHYLFKIESFSILLEEKIEKYESDDFQAGGYEWELCLYPNGNKKGNGKDHISLYLVIKDTDNLPHGWEVNVQFKLFVFDHIRDKYLTIQDAEGKIRRFHRMKTEWGFAQLLSLDTFNDTSNGYLLEDSCIFGAEVFVIKYAGKGECMSMIKVPKNNTFTWKVDNFSTITDIFLCSDEFKVGERKWKLELYPRGNAKPEGESLSLFLAMADYEALPLNWKVYAKFKLRIKDQINGSHIVKKTQCWFRASTRNWGFSSFEKLCNINDRGSSFIMKDTLIVEVEIMVMSAVKNFP